jgi:hypothetical protein
MGSHKEEGKKSNYTHRDVLDGIIDATDKACCRTNSSVVELVALVCVALVQWCCERLQQASIDGFDGFFAQLKKYVSEHRTHSVVADEFNFEM